jgi:hypothetical protein
MWKTDSKSIRATNGSPIHCNLLVVLYGFSPLEVKEITEKILR